MKVRHIVFALLGIGLAGLIVYRISANKAKDEDPKKGANKKPTAVSGIVLQPQAFVDNLSLSGSLDANEQIELHSEYSGVVESINFAEGSNVSKGQVLFKVNDTELRAQLAKAKTAENLASEKRTPRQAVAR